MPGSLFNNNLHLLGDCFCKVTKMKLFFKLDIQKFTISNRITHNTVAAVRRCSVKKVSLEITQHLQENTCARVSFLIKLQTLRLATLLKKETLAQVFSCKYCEISKNTLLTEHLWWLLLVIIN